MTVVAQAVKDWLVPGTPLFLLWNLTLAAILLLRRKHARVGRVWLVVIITTYWILSFPMTSRWLEAGLGGRFAPLAEAADAQGATAIVVLGGGSGTIRVGEYSLDILSSQSAFNVIEAARVSRLLGAPLIVVAGGRPNPSRQLRSEAEVMRDALVSLGIPASRIVVETTSVNTRSQAIEVPALLRARGVSRFVLVTAPRHMPRSVRLFRAQALPFVPSIAARASDGVSTGWLPSLEGLQDSRWAIHEYAAFVNSWMRGWF